MRDGMLLSTGKKYHDRRKIILPAFSFQMLEKYAEKYDSLGKIFIEKLKSFDADAEIEFFHQIGLYALDVICGMFHSGRFRTNIKFWCNLLRFRIFFVETVIGVNIDVMSQPDSAYMQAIIE